MGAASEAGWGGTASAPYPSPRLRKKQLPAPPALLPCEARAQEAAPPSLAQKVDRIRLGRVGGTAPLPTLRGEAAHPPYSFSPFGPFGPFGGEAGGHGVF